MLDRVINDILVLRYFILTAVGAGLLLSVAAAIMTAVFSWNTKSRFLYGWLYNRTNREMAFVSAVFLQLIFVISCLIFGTVMTPVCLVVLVVLSAAKWYFGRTTLLFLRDLLNSVLEFAALFVGNILSGYLRETRFNVAVMIVLVLLRVFLAAYQFYFFLKDLLATTSDMGVRTRKAGAGRKMPRKAAKAAVEGEAVERKSRKRSRKKPKGRIGIRRGKDHEEQ